MRRNYCPHISSETKMLLQERKALKEEMTKHVDPVLGKEVKKIKILYNLFNTSIF